MSARDDSAEKSHEPSQRKLDQAREKGEIPRFAELSTTLAYLGLLIAGTVFGAAALKDFGAALRPFVDRPERLGDWLMRDGSTAPTGTIVSAALVPVLPLLLLPGGFVLIGLLAQRGLLFTRSKLSPKLSRISPISNAKNKYGSRGLFEFAKSFAKLLIYSVCLALFLQAQLEEIVGIARGTPDDAIRLMLVLMMRFLGLVVIVALVIGGLDAAWQYTDHLKRNRMSHQELRDEHKEAEGDPHFKSLRRNRAEEIARNQMMAEVPRADVLIVNPVHVAVALKWSRLPGSAPVCVAKGKDELALRMREVATDAGVPIHADPPTARALHDTTDIGAEISSSQYRAVAAAIRFADDMRRKARARGGA